MEDEEAAAEANTAGAGGASAVSAASSAAEAAKKDSKKARKDAIRRADEQKVNEQKVWGVVGLERLKSALWGVAFCVAVKVFWWWRW